ncbi:MAG TPA: hypothetical protein VK327_00525, partial [Candidatus Paceibacterota bacterium]|nr:hypothetical protein [Candidatus Paceibacterota bacterium]
RALVGERCSGLAAFKSPLDIFRMSAESGATNKVTPEFEKMVASYVKGGTNKLDEKYYSEQMGSVISASELPFPDRLDKAQLWRVHLALEDTNGFIVSALLLSNLGKAPERSAVGVADLRVAQTVLAIERYRLRNTNSLPKSLKDLVPQYLDAVPSDPFDGQPLRFKILPQRGYLVYSIGNDRMDDGGIHKPEKPTAGSHYDLAMTVLK